MKVGVRKRLKENCDKMLEKKGGFYYKSELRARNKQNIRERE